MTLRTLNYGNYGIFLIMGNAGFCPSAVVLLVACSVMQAVEGEVSLSVFTKWRCINKAVRNHFVSYALSCLHVLIVFMVWCKGSNLMLGYHIHLQDRHGGLRLEGLVFRAKWPWLHKAPQSPNGEPNVFAFVVVQL